MLNNPRELIDGSERLSSISVVHDRLHEAIFNRQTTVAQISAIIMQDAGLTARLLRIVNSAYFGFPRKIDTISRAVMIIGTQQLHDLSIATSIVKLFRNIPERFVSMESFWKHGIACGLAARVIACLNRESNVERFFVAGILHDVGRLIMYDKIPDVMDEVFDSITEHPAPMFKAEQEIVGFDHAAVGGALIEAWRLPGSLEEVIRYHHTPMLASRYRDEACVIHIADVVAHTIQCGSSGEICVPPFDEEAWLALGLNPGFLPQIFDLVDRNLDSVLKMFHAGES
ncbi:MAG TPA: HDOD domain-containing protein [Bacteroidota bacterium]|nr:HDOD domain-containing protein [Bacteroidota bacterium]